MRPRVIEFWGRMALCTTFASRAARTSALPVTSRLFLPVRAGVEEGRSRWVASGTGLMAAPSPPVAGLPVPDKALADERWRTPKRSGT